MPSEETLLDPFIMLFVSSDSVEISARPFGCEKQGKRVSNPRMDEVLISRPGDARDFTAALQLSSESDSENDPQDSEVSDDGTTLSF